MNKKEFGILAVLFLLALTIRLWGIKAGLPLLTHADEEDFFGPALNITFNLKSALVTKNFWLLDPQFFIHPHLFINLSALVFTIFRKVWEILNSLGFVASVSTLLRTDFFLVGRLFNAFVGALTVPVAFMLGRKLMEKKWSYLAALILAFLPLHVERSRMVSTDILAGLLVTLCLAVILSLFERFSVKRLFMSSALLGLSFSTSFSGIFLFIPLLIVVFYLAFKDDWDLFSVLGKLVFVAAIAWLMFFITSPFCMFRFLDFIIEILKTGARESHGVLGNVHSSFFYLISPKTNDYGYALGVSSLWEGLSPTLLIILLISVVWSFFRKGIKLVVLSTLLLVWYLFFSRYLAKSVRWFTPVTPIMPVLIVAFFSRLYANLKGGRVNRVFFPILLSVSLIPALVSTAVLVNSFVVRDIRLIALDWINENIPKGSTILTVGSQSVPFGIFDYEKDILYFETYNDLGQLERNSAPRFRRRLCDKNADFMIVTSATYSAYFDPEMERMFPETCASWQDFYHQVNAELILLRTFDPEADGWPRLRQGPVIKIYEIPEEIKEYCRELQVGASE